MKKPKIIFSIFVLIIFISSILLQLNNIKLFNTDLGFDGSSHKEYITYISKYHSIPPPNGGWEFNQTPLYYILSSVLSLFNVSPQIINLVLLYLITFLIYRTTKSYIGALAVLSLPMLNYFPPLITNELLGSFFIILGLLALLNKQKPEILALILSLGFYSKYTVITIIPLVPLSYFLFEKHKLIAFKKTVLCLSIFLLLISPILLRNIQIYKNPLPLASNFYSFHAQKQSTSLNFFFDLSWIPKLDIFNANNYSLTGGLWSSFWLDGYHVITPVVTFHKKAFILWLLGFPLTVICIAGLIKYFQRDKNKGIILISYIFLAIFSLVKYYLDLPYNFVLKAFYAFGLVVPYTIGLSEAFKIKRLWMITIIILLIQFWVMISFFWIQPWWHVAK